MILALLLSVPLLGLLFLAIPELDIVVSRLFFTASGEFIGDGLAAMRLWNEIIEASDVALLIFIVIGLAWNRLSHLRYFGLTTRGLLFVLVTFVLGPGLLVNGVLKSYWGRARPEDSIPFGGDATFSPPLLISDQCAQNCSFVCGDCAMAFAMLAFALVIPGPRIALVAAALLLAGWTGLVRISQGGHFFSDFLFAGIFISLLTLLLFLAFRPMSPSTSTRD